MAENVLKLRASGNWTTLALSEHARIDRTTLRRLEHGEGESLTIRTVDKIAAALGVRTGSLFSVKPITRREHETAIGDILSVNLIKARARLHWTQEMLSVQSGVQRPLIAHIERRVQNPSLGTVMKLTAVIDMTLERILSESRGRHGEG